MYQTTTCLEKALAGGYIGEVPLVPSPLYNAICFLLRGTVLWQGTVYYFGERNAELDRRFGYDQARDH